VTASPPVQVSKGAKKIGPGGCRPAVLRRHSVFGLLFGRSFGIRNRLGLRFIDRSFPPSRRSASGTTQYSAVWCAIAGAGLMRVASMVLGLAAREIRLRIEGRSAAGSAFSVARRCRHYQLRAALLHPQSHIVKNRLAGVVHTQGFFSFGKSHWLSLLLARRWRILDCTVTRNRRQARESLHVALTVMSPATLPLCSRCHIVATETLPRWPSTGYCHRHTVRTRATTSDCSRPPFASWWTGRATHRGGILRRFLTV